MKTILFILSLLAISTTTTFAQTREINKFYQKHRHDEGVINISIPGWLIRWGGKIARKHTKDDPAAMAALKMVKKFKGMRLLVSENANEFPMASYQKMTQRLTSRGGFEDLIMIKSPDANVNIMAQGKNDKLKHLLFLVNEDDTFVMLSMRTKLKMKDFVKMVNEIIRAEKSEERKQRPQA